MPDVIHPDDAISSPSAVLSGWFIWISLGCALGCKQEYRKKWLSQIEFSLFSFFFFFNLFPLLWHLKGLWVRNTEPTNVVISFDSFLALCKVLFKVRITRVIGGGSWFEVLMCASDRESEGQGKRLKSEQKVGNTCTHAWSEYRPDPSGSWGHCPEEQQYVVSRGAVVLGSSGFWELVLCLEQDAHLPQCWAVIFLPSRSWWGKESAQKHNLTSHFPASGPRCLLSFFKYRGPGCFTPLKLPSTSWPVISFLCDTFLPA